MRPALSRFRVPPWGDVACQLPRHHLGMKHEATTARLDVLEAAVLALAEALPATHASAARSGLLQRVEDLSDPVAPAADAAAARTLAAVLMALSR